MPISESMVQDIVQEVMAKMQIADAPTGKHGIFKDMNDAIEAAKKSELIVKKMSMDQREKIITCIRKKIKENANTVSMVADVSGDNSSLNMEQSDSLAAVKAAMARPTSFSPRCVESTKPSLYIESTAIEADGQTLASISDYSPKESHSFYAGISYTDVDGIVTFRGNNFRDTAAYGNTQIKDGKIKDHLMKNDDSFDTYFSKIVKISMEL